MGRSGGGFDCRLRCSLEILSVKYVANSWGRADRGCDVGRERTVVLCNMLLMFFQSVLGFVDD